MCLGALDSPVEILSHAVNKCWRISAIYSRINGISMAKIYFVVMAANDDLAAAVLDTDKLPEGVESGIVESPWSQATEITDFVLKDLQYGLQIVNELAACKPSQNAARFFSKVASFWENLPPQTDGEEKDGLFGIIATQGQFIRTSPEVARDTYNKLRDLRAPREA